jgi:hypothetical protein
MGSAGEGKETDDVAGPAQGAEEEEEVFREEEPQGPDPDAIAPPPAEVEELAAACVRFVSARYGVPLDYRPDTLSMLDQWVRDARVESEERAEVIDLVQSTAGAYLGEVLRREFGGRWVAAAPAAEHAEWRLFLSTVYCSFNPLGMVREALLLAPAEGWHAHLELDPAEKEAIQARLDALPSASEDEFYAPSTRYDVLSIVFDALREGMRARGLADVRFGPEDYGHDGGSADAPPTPPTHRQ